jgi:hypothetical protein
VFQSYSVARTINPPSNMIVSSSASRSAAGTATAPPTGTGAATAGAATGATTSASSAVTRGDLGTGIVLSGLVALAGAVLGAGLVV